MIGIVLLMADVAHPGLFLLVPAAVLVAIGILFLASPDIFLSNPLAAALIMLAAGCGGAVAAIPVYQRIAPTHPPIATTLDTLVGSRGLVSVEVRPHSMKGKVEVRDETWSATSDAPIAKGQVVKVVGGEGLVLKVVSVSNSTESKETA